MKRIVFALLLLPFVFLAGCGLLWDDPFVVVTVTPLNWVEIHYYNTNRDPVLRTSVRISGDGLVTVRRGTSRRVSDDFAKDFKDNTWEDMRETTYMVDPEHVKDVFQNLVNNDLLDREKHHKATKHAPKGKFIAARAALDNKAFSEPMNLYETDPDLAELLHSVLLEFSNALIGKR